MERGEIPPLLGAERLLLHADESAWEVFGVVSCCRPCRLTPAAPRAEQRRGRLTEPAGGSASEFGHHDTAVRIPFVTMTD